MTKSSFRRSMVPQALQSLVGHNCPYCGKAELRFCSNEGVNICPSCRGEVITEYEWQRRQKQSTQRVKASGF